ncbi:MAG: helix-turn-helix domain-containing protein [Advenella sp.]|uniref:IclR family transcriptional regulator n=1 Tax=Advenella kashmirensis TaxID=310575 RepID=A0A356LC11_9BURK|nr:helix-turn-helix domain-containing protein [Advenella sp. FME57]HBP28101.1 hypothetical protein [Advenella kashmirensis]
MATQQSMLLVVRTLELLRAMNRQPASTLVSLQQETGMPKTTIHRLLATLKNEGYVRSDVVRGIYSLTEKVRLLSEGFSEHETIVEQAIPILLRTTRETGLPFAIGIAEHSHMVVRYSSMPYSPIGPMHTTVGNTHSMLDSALGQVYLAFCNDEERERLIAWHETGELSENEWRSVERGLRAQLALVKSQKYALRLPNKQHQNATLAVPVLHERRILAVLSVTTFPSVLIGAKTGELANSMARVADEVACLSITAQQFLD